MLNTLSYGNVNLTFIRFCQLKMDSFYWLILLLWIRLYFFLLVVWCLGLLALILWLLRLVTCLFFILSRAFEQELLGFLEQVEDFLWVLLHHAFLGMVKFHDVTRLSWKRRSTSSIGFFNLVGVLKQQWVWFLNLWFTYKGLCLVKTLVLLVLIAIFRW